MTLEEQVRQMPKIELHVHVEGAVNAETYYQLALENKVQLPVDSLEEWRLFFEFKDFTHFIDVYMTAVQAVKKPSDYTFIIEQFYKHQKEHNIIYSEAFLSASFLVERFEVDDILDAIDEGIRLGEENYNVVVKFIPDIARNIPHTQTDVLNLIIEGYKRGVFIGMGLGGLEMGYPPEMFRESFASAKLTGMHVVAHAGEGSGPESIWGAIHSLNAARIGHGIRCIEDPKLLEFLKSSQLPVEVSPKSNYCLKVVNADEPHPIRIMVDNGVFCTVNSDDPAMFSTNLSEEYMLLHRQGFTWEELWQLNLNALHAAFLTEDERNGYLAVFEGFMEGSKQQELGFLS